MPIKEIKDENLEKIKQESERMRREVQERTLGYIVGALGLVAGLAWNEAIRAVIEYAFPLAKDTLQAKLFYAVVMTIVVVLLSMVLIRLFGKKGENKK
jgi:hypothetical protein